MRKILLLILAGSFLFACNNNKTTERKAIDDSTKVAGLQTTLPAAINAIEEILGSFVGAFGNNKITLLITKAQGDSVEGRSIVGGNDRPFRGTFALGEGIYKIHAVEPGDHKDDGVFDFAISKSDLNKVSGSWKPNDMKRPAKEFSLDKKKFEYRTDVGAWPETSQRLLKPEDVDNIIKEDLEYMRNEIFARHGFCFKKKHLRQQFEMQDWYVPNTVDIRGFLTDIEKKNIEMIKRYEKYAVEYGDEYGR